MRTRIFRFSEKLKKAQITLQISLLTKQTLFIRLFVFCSFAPSPHGYSVSRGVPNSKKSEFLDSNSLKTARICKYNNSLKSQNFDGFSGFLTGSCEGAYFAVRN